MMEFNGITNEIGDLCYDEHEMGLTDLDNCVCRCHIDSLEIDPEAVIAEAIINYSENLRSEVINNGPR